MELFTEAFNTCSHITLYKYQNNHIISYSKHDIHFENPIGYLLDNLMTYHMLFHTSIFITFKLNNSIIKTFTFALPMAEIITNDTFNSLDKYIKNDY